MTPPNIKDVARLAGVSTTTVSRVLANERYVKEGVRRTVQEAMEQLNYQPSRTARSLRSRRSKIIGLIISDIQNPFFISLVRAVEDVAYRQKYAVFLISLDPRLVLTGTPRKEVGYRLTEALLDLSEPPTALFTGNNLLTVGALRAIHQRGLHVPDNIALAGFDEIDFMPLVRPELTVFAQPTYELGKMATNLLLQRIGHPSRPSQKIMVKGSLMIRQSCAHHAVGETFGNRGDSQVPLLSQIGHQERNPENRIHPGSQFL